MASPGVVVAADADRGWRTRSRRAGVLKTREHCIQVLALDDSLHGLEDQQAVGEK